MAGSTMEDVDAVRAAMAAAVAAAAAEAEAECAAQQVVSTSTSLAPIDETEKNEVSCSRCQL